MRVLPAVDLREGACVQLVGGAYDAERIRLSNPLEVSQSWRSAGFKALHVVDLDAATGRGANKAQVQQLVRHSGLEVQVGGGVRSEEAISELLGEGVARVVIGTRALEDPAWLATVTGRFPGRLLIAADVRGRNLVTRGWATTLRLDILERVAALNAFPLAGLLVTAVHKEGQMLGTDLTLMREVVEASNFPVLASGGVGRVEDLRALVACKVMGAVVGMALYTGALDAAAVASEFGS